MNSSEAKKTKAIQLLNEAWNQRQEELINFQSEQIQGLERETAKIRKELDLALLKISQLEEEKTRLEQGMREAAQENNKYEHLKAALMDTLNQTSSPHSSFRSQIRNSVSFDTPDYKAGPKKTFNHTESHQAQTVDYQSSPQKALFNDDFQESDFEEQPDNRIVDGKKFFAETRDRLPFEKFSKFLAVVKKINDKAIDTRTAISEVKDLFGTKNNDLLQDFISLVSRKVE